jgi:hypothetical protein
MVQILIDMSDPEIPQIPERIDYDREYRERFEKAKQQAEAKSLKYNYPQKAGIGWKIHLVQKLIGKNLDKSICQIPND